MSAGPQASIRHVSLEREFFAVVRPQPPPWHRRLSWWLLLRLAALKPVQALLLKRTRS